VGIDYTSYSFLPKTNKVSLKLPNGREISFTRTRHLGREAIIVEVPSKDGTMNFHITDPQKISSIAKMASNKNPTANKQTLLDLLKNDVTPQADSLVASAEHTIIASGEMTTQLSLSQFQLGSICEFQGII